MNIKSVILPAAIYALLCSAYSFGNISNFRAGTWNLQGASASTESKWDINVRQLVTGINPITVLALQEAGAVPRRAALLRQLPSPAGTTIPVREFSWNLGTATRPNIRYIYFAECDTGARRVNVALVTARQADDIVALPNPVNPQNGRPLLGVGFRRANGPGLDYFFTIHAFATGAGDAVPSIIAVQNHVAATDPASQWMLMGDYNLNPDQLNNRIDANGQLGRQNILLLSQDQPTHRRGNTLDYAVAGPSTLIPVGLTANNLMARLHGQLASNHTPVAFF